MNTLPSTEPTANGKPEKIAGRESSPSPEQPISEKKTRKPPQKSLASVEVSTKKPSSRSARKVPVPTKHNDHKLRDTKSIEVRKRLGITPQQMYGVPRISHILDCASGGIEECVNALRLSDDADASKFLERYDSVSASDRQRLSIEEIAISAGVGTKNLLAAVLLAMDYVGTSQARMATNSFKAPVIGATGKAAINGPNATSNRKLFLSGIEFLPRPANREPGVFVNITNQNAAAARAMHEANEAPPAPIIEATPATPYINTEEQLRQLHGEIDGQRQLDAPRELGEAVEVGNTFVEDELECIPSGEI